MLTTKRLQGVNELMSEIVSLKNYISGFRGVICDLWGVVHNGSAALPGAVLSLRSIRQMNLFVVLLSNSPRLSKTVVKQLEGLGLPGNCFNAIVTSGDIACEYMEFEMKDACFFHLGPERDRLTVDSLSNPETTNPGEAEVILCTGYFEDRGFQFELYEDLLRNQITRDIPLVCANPDKEVNIGEKRFLCAGTLAGHYERLGGKVIWLGKPEKVAYQKCFGAAEKITGIKFQPSDFLAIGDNLETDIRGAKNLGIRTVFIAEGLHGHVGTDAEKLEALFDKVNIRPDTWMKRLEWN